MKYKIILIVILALTLFVSVAYGFNQITEVRYTTTQPDLVRALSILLDDCAAHKVNPAVKLVASTSNSKWHNYLITCPTRWMSTGASAIELPIKLPVAPIQ